MLPFGIDLFSLGGAAAADAAVTLHVAVRSLDQLDALAHLDSTGPRGEPVLRFRFVVADRNGDDDEAKNGQTATDTDLAPMLQNVILFAAYC
jgi:hypothetical protein